MAAAEPRGAPARCAPCPARPASRPGSPGSRPGTPLPLQLGLGGCGSALQGHPQPPASSQALS